MRTTYWILLAITVCGLAPPTAVAAGEAFKQETVLDSLHNPCGIAVRPPGGAELFVAESSAGRILRVKLSEPNKPETAIEGFPRAVWQRPRRPHRSLRGELSRSVDAGSRRRWTGKRRRCRPHLSTAR